jgi:MarR family transcriptional regulator, multiple antibiotic resistance protein MarR
MGIDDIPDHLSHLKVEDPQGLYQLEGYRISESLGYLIKRTGSLLSNAIDQELAEFDLTHQQFSILMVLGERNCSTAADLARETCGDTGAMTRMLDRLEAKGFLRRVRSSEDRRVINIELTETGRLVGRKMPVVAINVMNRYLQGISPGELELMKSLLRRVLVNGGTPVPAWASGKSEAE